MIGLRLNLVLTILELGGLGKIKGIRCKSSNFIAKLVSQTRQPAIPMLVIPLIQPVFWFSQLYLNI